jgi:hypothetical protein
MTGYISGVPDPLSSLTVAALRDLGYSVNMAQAEAYTLPGHVASSVPSTPGTNGSVVSGSAGVTALDMPFVNDDEDRA